MSAHSQKRRQTIFAPHPSMRLASYDYQTAGAYAMNICAHDRSERLFNTPTVEGILKEE